MDAKPQLLKSIGDSQMQLAESKMLNKRFHMEDRDEESNHQQSFVRGLRRGGDDSWVKHSFLLMQIFHPITQPEKAEILFWGCHVPSG